MPVRTMGTDASRVLRQSGLFGICCAAAVAIHAIVAADTLEDGSALSLNAGGIVLLVAAVVISILAARAAQRRSTRVTLTALSAALAAVAASFAWSSYPDISVELADLIAPAAAAEAPTTIVVGPTGRDVRLSGDIREGAARQLTAILDAHPDITRIHLTSEGGIADEGEDLAKVIAAHHLTTYVPDFCISACTLAFVAGRERLLKEGAQLGFHAPYLEGLLGQSFAGDSSEQRAAYIAAGVASDFVAQALKVNPDDMWVPTDARLLQAHVATGFVDSYRFPDSILDGNPTPAGARAAVLRNYPALAAFEAGSPKAIDKIAAWYLDAYRHGTSEGDAADSLDAMVPSALSVAHFKTD